MPAIIEMFPEVVIELQKEISRNHPKLVEILAEMPVEAGMEERVAVVAAYCGMVLDGYYDEAQLEIIFHDMIKELRKRAVITIH